MKSIYLVLVAVLSLAGYSSYAASIEKNSYLGEYEIVRENQQVLLLFKPKTIRELILLRNDSQLGDIEKMNIIKGKLFIDAASIGDGKSYCDQFALLYQNASRTEQGLSKTCNRVITHKDFLWPLIVDPLDMYDLREINKAVAMYFYLFVLSVH